MQNVSASRQVASTLNGIVRALTIAAAPQAKGIGVASPNMVGLREAHREDH